MAITTGKNGLPLPRSLADARAIRRELVAVYRQMKGGVIDPQLGGRLVHTLNVIAGLDANQLLDERSASSRHAWRPSSRMATTPARS